MEQFLKMLTIYEEKIPHNIKIDSNYAKDNHIQSSGASKFNEFENVTCSALDKLSNILKKNGIKFKFNFGKTFPDIDIIINNGKPKTYGLELKSRKAHGYHVTGIDWENNGGSIFESRKSIKHTHYSNIYIFFGLITRHSNTYKIRWKQYSDTIDNIEVTHKPRYHINMNTDPSDRIFSSWNDYYNTICNMNNFDFIRRVQQDLRHKVSTSRKGPQWYTNSPILFTHLPNNVQNNFISKMMIIFPQEILKYNSNYKNISKSFIKHLYYMPSIERLFPVSQKCVLRNVQFPKIVNNMIQHADNMKKLMNHYSNTVYKPAYLSWSNLNLNMKPHNTYINNLFTNYCIVINYLGNKFVKNELKQIHVKNLSHLIFHSINSIS